jgi:hypothetical protein
MMFDPHTAGEQEGASRPFTIPLPFLRESIGSGDMVKSLTDALSIRQCGGCEQRQEAMNRAVQFRPLRSLWED